MNLVYKDMVLLRVFLAFLKKKACLELFYTKKSGINTNTYTTHFYAVSDTIPIRGLTQLDLFSGVM